MKKNLLVILLAAVATSGIWIIGIAAWHSMWSRNYTSIVLTDDVVLKADWTNEVVGTLKKGVVLLVPDYEDYGMTDPGDSNLHKVYVRLKADMEGKYLRVPTELSPTNRSVTVYNCLDMYPQR